MLGSVSLLSGGKKLSNLLKLELDVLLGTVEDPGDPSWAIDWGRMAFWLASASLVVWGWECGIVGGMGLEDGGTPTDFLLSLVLSKSSETDGS